jgi:rhodanese-related sulfurtransferase
MMPLTETGVMGQDGALWIAPLLGFAFGFLLERAGLAHAPRLAGQFYFTDFTVFKVMFTALVTAMLGAFWLNRLGLLDITLLYIPETFVLAQAVGGVLFGAGFLLSGLCPGTSCVAAASGRWDGLAVVGGILVGVFAFNAAFDLLNPLYSATALGPITLAQVAGVSTGTMVSLVTMLALAGFIFFGRLRRNDKVPARGRNRALLATATTLALAAVLINPRAPAGASAIVAPNYISAIELGERIARQDPTLRVMDLRDEGAYESFHIPTAIRTTLEDLVTTPRGATIVLYDDAGVAAAKGEALLESRGYASVHVLREGIYEWIARVQEPLLASDATAAERAEFERAAKLSRFFGGVPMAGVSRAEIPTGYWTGAASGAGTQARARDAVEAMRRRGC